jgi:COMPASS component SWD3
MNQPREGDAILGGQIPAPSSGSVLGGLAGVTQRLASDFESVRIVALQEALNYGQSGLDLIVYSLEDQASMVQKTAYQLLRPRAAELNVREAFWGYTYRHRFKCLHTLTDVGRWIGPIALSANGQTLAMKDVQDMTINLWNFQASQAIATVRNGMKDQLETVKVWDLNTRQIIHALPSLNDPIKALLISPDGKNLITGSSGSIEHGAVRIWNLTTGKEISKINLPSAAKAGEIAVSSNWQTLCCGGYGSYVVVLDLLTGKELRILDIYGCGDSVQSICFSPNGELLASCARDRNGGFLTVWDWQTGQRIYNLKCGGSEPWKVTFSPDSKTLAVNIDTVNVRLWDMDTGKEIGTINTQITRPKIAFGFDGQTLFSSDHHRIQIWNWQTGKLFHSLKGGHMGDTSFLSMSMDGQTLVTGGGDGQSDRKEIKIWGTA